MEHRLQTDYRDEQPQCYTTQICSPCICIGKNYETWATEVSIVYMLYD